MENKEELSFSCDVKDFTSDDMDVLNHIMRLSRVGIMTREEYLSVLSAIQHQYYSCLDELARAYVERSCPYKVGDVFTDHLGSIRIQRVYVTNNRYNPRELPSCYFKGVELKKDGTPRKNQTGREAYWENDIHKQKDSCRSISDMMDRFKKEHS